MVGTTHTNDSLSPIAFITGPASVQPLLQRFGLPGEPPHLTPAHGPRLDDADIDQRPEVELGAPEPIRQYEFDKRVTWRGCRPISSAPVPAARLGDVRPITATDRPPPCQNTAMSGLIGSPLKPTSLLATGDGPSAKIVYEKRSGKGWSEFLYSNRFRYLRNQQFVKIHNLTRDIVRGIARIAATIKCPILLPARGCRHGRGMPGQIQFLDYNTLRHGRMAFTDWPELECGRHLVRLRLRGPRRRAHND